MWTEPGVLGGIEIFPGDMESGFSGSSPMSARRPEVFAVDIDPRVARRMLRLAHDIGAVVNAVEIDRLAVVVHPRAMGRRGEADHRRQRCPAVDVRHHLAIT